MISMPFLRRSNLDVQPGRQFCEVTRGGGKLRVAPADLQEAPGVSTLWCPFKGNGRILIAAICRPCW